jgi:GT2 family glycosyltransferase
MGKQMISVVVLNWNGRQHLEACLSSLFEQTFHEFEVILVDNGSTDGSIEFVRTLFPEVRIIALEKNLGFCGGNNIGIRAAQGDLVALLNNDTEADRKWLEALNDAAIRRPDVGCFASKMLSFYQRNLIDDAGDEFHAAGFSSKRGWLEEDGPQYNEECEVFGTCAGAASYRRTMLDEIGLFDEHFFATGEDVELSFRAHLKGYKCLYVPNAIIYHKAGAAVGQTTAWFYRMRRNQLWTTVKNMPWQLFVKYMPQIVAYNALSLIYHSLQGRGKLIWRAYFDAFRDLPRVMSQRRYIQSSRVAPVRDIEAVLTKGGLRHRISNPITSRKAIGNSYKLR